MTPRQFAMLVFIGALVVGAGVAIGYDAAGWLIPNEPIHLIRTERCA